MPEIQNPNLQTQGPGGGGSGGDMRMTIAFFALMLVVLLGYQYFFKPPVPAPAPSQPAQSAPQSGQQATQPAAPGQAPAAASPARAAASTPVIGAPIESDITVENEMYKIVLTNRGARVKHWILKHYTDTAGKPLDLVQPQASERFGYPLSLFTYEPQLTAQLNDALYQSNVTGAQPSATGLVVAPTSITYRYSAGGVDVVKTLRFDSSYVVTIEAEVKHNGEPVRSLVEWPAGLGDMEEFLPSSSTRSQIRTSASSLFAWSLNGKDDSEAPKKVSNDATLTEPYSYAAVMDLYFAAAFLPDDPAATSVVTLHNAVDLPSKLDDPNSTKTPADVLGLAIGSTSGFTRVRLFAGPKATDTLAAIHAIGADGKPTGPSLEPLIQFGFWTFIAKPLYLALRFLHDHMGGSQNNWGWAIIIFTTTFTVIMLPFRFMAMKSQLKMMRVQPKVDAIKNKYKSLKATDPKRADMNAEMMELYKVEGVNMYGGCLPMLPQIPLFFAYFRVLQNAVELRQAHWFWLTDLSSPDPIYILPILIIVSMFLVQILTPSPGMDPAQRRMMAFMMPVMMGFFLLHYASGLALYWCTSNIINLALQLSINRSHYGKEMHAIAAKKAAKKLGVNPKTIQGRR